MINLDMNNLQQKSQEVANWKQYYDMIGGPIVSECSKDLDTVIQRASDYLSYVRKNHSEYDIGTLQIMVHDVANAMYFTRDKFEKQSYLADVAEMKYKDKYNDAYTSRQEAATVDRRKYTSDQLRALSEQEAIEEKIISLIYKHVVEELGDKLDSANDNYKALSKILSSRTEEMKLSASASRY